MLPAYFAPDEVKEIWLTFPDPHLRTSRAKKRLTHPRFLRLYQQVICAGGTIHLKTDSPKLYQFTKRVIEFYNLLLTEDLNHVYENDQHPELKITTHYEALDISQSNTVYYLQFKLPAVMEDKDAQLQQVLKQEENVD